VNCDYGDGSVDGDGAIFDDGYLEDGTITFRERSSFRLQDVLEIVDQLSIDASYTQPIDPIEKNSSVPRVYPWVNAGGYFDIIDMTWRRDYPATQHIELNIISCGYQNTGVGS